MEETNRFIPLLIDLARCNINILSVATATEDSNHSNHSDLYVVFEFQWRDPRNHCARWCKTMHKFCDGQRLTERSLFTELKGVVQKARVELEGLDYGG